MNEGVILDPGADFGASQEIKKHTIVIQIWDVMTGNSCLVVVQTSDKVYVCTGFILFRNFI